MTLTATARAKVNLYLHVAAPDARGYHPLRSMVAFADIGDEVQLVFGGKGRLRIDGPYAEGLSTGEDNLIMKAVRLFEEATGDKNKVWDYRLTKNLPLASGIGGGSADAGAMLRLLRDWNPEMSQETFFAIASKTGADGVMCAWSKSCIAEGYGEKLSPIILPSLPCVLINPGVECPTPEVFQAYDEAGSYRSIYTRWIGEDVISAQDLVHGSVLCFSHNIQLTQLIDYLNTTRNDLEAPAISLQPVIGKVLADLREQSQTLFARMSGSGATCFALCRTDEDAEALSVRLRVMYPSGWVRRCRLG
ncbi:4-(cytidine 5'-diphospho)-2-C-methyl-D-erythritol kinase [Asticcacaulis benevestitus]|uniref:4-(cytidine 5'-diphospho)-2-C-methyl-D-erythritol kinase n=1 Tax=Asticcacaulis benevestitus TaxID=347481 RepID=UPI000477FF8A|nr:4-(cytidine 5'-diphospho)-2-C-methyl-D-erythritol kinase [Asticcacaulis benevestitus]